MAQELDPKPWQIALGCPKLWPLAAVGGQGFALWRSRPLIFALEGALAPVPQGFALGKVFHWRSLPLGVSEHSLTAPKWCVPQVGAHWFGACHILVRCGFATPQKCYICALDTAENYML